MRDYNDMSEPTTAPRTDGNVCANCRMDVPGDATVCPNCDRCPSCGYSTDPDADRPCPNADLR